MAVPSLIPSRAFGAGDRIVIGGIGVGNQGSSLVRGFASRASIAAIADVYLPRAQKVAESVGAKDVYQDYRKLLTIQKTEPYPHHRSIWFADYYHGTRPANK